MEVERTQSTQSVRSRATISVISESPSNFIPEKHELRTSRSSSTSSLAGENFATRFYGPTLFGLIVLGMVHYLLCLFFSEYPRLHGFLQLCLGLFGWEWFDLFGSRLSRKEQFFFDEKNILENSKNFDFLLLPCVDSSTGTGLNKIFKYLKNLVADPKQTQLQEVHQQHESNVYGMALRAEQDAKAAQASATSAISPLAESQLKTVKSSESATNLLNTIKSGQESETIVSPKPAESKESQKTK